MATPYGADMLAVLIIAQLSISQPATGAAALVARARAARYQQDSMLSEYRAMVKQRFSAGVGLATVFGVGVPGRERLAARFESVARVGWHHQRGAWGEIIGSRSVVPFAGGVEPDWEDDIALVLP